MSSIFSFLARFFQQKYAKSLLVFGVMIFIGVCFGQHNAGPQYETADLTKNIIEIFDLLFGLLALILGPMVILAGWLLSPDWTMGDFFGLRGYFKEVWILVANIVYIIFALMLLWMAIAQIFGGAENTYAFKKKLGPFLVGILIVPFTWLIVSWTLSFANQAVAAVLSIPMGAIGKLDTGGIPGQQNKSQWHRKVLPTQFDFSGNASGYGPGVKCEGGFVTQKGATTTTPCISPAEFLAENQAGPFFIIMVYAYNIFKIQEADMTPLRTLCTGKASQSSETQYKSAKTCVEDLMGILRNFGLSLIITVFFAIMLIALCWILLMRAIKLWIYIMLSPLFGLAYFTGKGFGESVGEAGESGFGQVGFKSFFKLAMVPVLVSAVLAFGLLFVGVVRDSFNGGLKDKGQTEFCTEQNVGYMVTYCITENTEGADKKVYTSKLIIGTDNNLSNGDAKITLNFGDSFSKIISTSEATSVAAGGVAGGISSVEDIFAHIILTMLALVFMFMGVQAAAKFDPVTEAAFKPFAKLGESVGNFVAHSPSYLPLPHPAFAAFTPAGMKGLSTKLDQIRYEKDQQMAKSAANIFDGDVNGYKSALNNNTTSVNDLARQFDSVKNKLDGSEPKYLADTLIKTFRNAADSPAKTEFMEAVEDNKNNQKNLQRIAETQGRKLLDSVLPDDRSGAESILNGFASLSGHASSSSTPRTVSIGSASATISGDHGRGHTITMGGRSLSVNISGSPASGTILNDSIYTNIKNHIAPLNRLNDMKAREIFPDSNIDDIKRYFGISP